MERRSRSRSSAAKASRRASRRTIARTRSRSRSTAQRPEDLVQPRPRQPAQSQAGWRARADRAHRGEHRSRAPCRPQPRGVICEVMNDDGTNGARARPRDLLQAPSPEDGHDQGPDRLPAAQRTLLGRYARRCDPPPIEAGECRGRRLSLDPRRQASPCAGQGEVAGQQDVLVRVHSECVTGDVFHSPALRLRRAAASGPRDDRGRGTGRAALTSRRRVRGIGLLNKLRGLKLQEDGLDTVEANGRLGLPSNLRDYGIGAQILVDLGSRRSASSPTTEEDPRPRGLRPVGDRQIPIEPGAESEQRRLSARQARQARPHSPPPGLDLDAELPPQRAGGQSGAIDAALCDRRCRFYSRSPTRLRRDARSGLESDGRD